MSNGMTRRVVWVVAFVISAAVLIPVSGFETPETAPDKPVIRRDRFGVPHILAQTEAGAAFALGYAAAEDHFDSLARLFLRARGQQAAHFGEKFVKEDLVVAQFGIRDIAERKFPGLPPLTQALFNGYAEGYNLYLSQRKDAPAWATPITGIDVLAHCRAVLLLDLGVIDRNPRLPPPPPNPESTKGSNLWAIGKEKSASGHGILLGNPHLPWEGSLRFHEVHVTVPGRVNVAGATLIGFPVVGIGFTEHHAWSHTASNQDTVDVYELTLNPQNPSEYRYEGGFLPLRKKTVAIAVKTPTGMETLQREIAWSHHGVVLRMEKDKAFVLKSSELEAVDFVTQWNLMAQARSLDEFKRALQLQGIPAFNIGYADRDGHVLMLFNARLPNRPQGFDWAQPVAGHLSATEWYTTLPFGELPLFVDPPGGYIQHSNDAPWFVNDRLGFKKADYPLYKGEHLYTTRGQYSLDVLGKAGKLDLEQVKQHKMTDRIFVADRVKAELLEILKPEVANDPVAQRAVAALTGWDNRSSAGSRGTAFFLRWWHDYRQRAKPIWKTEWTASQPTTTPTGLGDPVSALAAVKSAAEQVEKAYGRLDTPWGEIARFRHNGQDLPLSGSSETFRTIDYKRDKDGKMSAAFGDGYAFVAELSNPVKVFSVLAYSQSSNPGSPHAGDQSAMFASGGYKKFWFTEEEIRANLERSYTPSAGNAVERPSQAAASRP